MEEKLMIWAIPAFLILITTDWLVSRLQNKKAYRYNDSITNLNIGIGNQVISVLTKAAIIGIIFWVHDHFSIWSVKISWWSWILCAILYDFLFYWAHRWSHEINVLWGAHVVHHQSEEYNLTVALRQPWFHHLLAFFIFLPLPIMGFDPITILSVSAVSTLYQFWIHTKSIHKFPAVAEWILNTPSHHRVHHAVNPKYIDKNHGAMLIIWDRFFGTFKEEEEEPTYGITTPFQSLNPAWANFHYYADILKKMKKMRGKDRLKMIFARPGWLPEDMGGYQKPPEVTDQRIKYNPHTVWGMNVYVLIQFVFIIWALIAYLGHFSELSTFFQLFFAGLIVLSAMICGGILEKKKWIAVAEYVRLAMVLFAVNAIYYYQYTDWFVAMVVFSGICFILFNTWFSISLKRNYHTLFQ